MLGWCSIFWQLLQKPSIATSTRTDFIYKEWILCCAKSNILSIEITYLSVIHLSASLSNSFFICILLDTEKVKQHQSLHCCFFQYCNFCKTKRRKHCFTVRLIVEERILYYRVSTNSLTYTSSGVY